MPLTITDYYTESLIKAGVFEYISTAQSEGTTFGPNWSSKLLDHYIESTGGLEYWTNLMYEEWND